MTSLEVEWPMAKAKRDDLPVRIKNHVLARAKIAASYAGKSLGQYISDALGPVIDRDIEEGHSRLNIPAENPAPKRPKR
jgi:hypothetical protein